MVRPTSNVRTLAGLDVKQIEGDLNDLGSLERACRGVRLVYQTASYYPSHTVPVNMFKNFLLHHGLRHEIGIVRKQRDERILLGRQAGWPP